MMSASDGGSPPTTAGVKLPDACGVAAISMPRSSAAVLTLVSTPLRPGSCAVGGLGELSEVPADEGDSDVREGFGSGAMGKKIQDRRDRTPEPVPRPAADRLPRLAIALKIYQGRRCLCRGFRGSSELNLTAFNHEGHEVARRKPNEMKSLVILSVLRGSRFFFFDRQTDPHPARAEVA